MTSIPRLKTICKLFTSVGYRHDPHRLFADFCEAGALAIANSVDLRHREAREARYLEIVGRYDRDVIDTFPRVLAEITMAQEEAPGDLLGAVFSELGFNNKHAGQFFTPYEVCQLMARLQVGDGTELRERIEHTGFVTAMEPACGAGAMVIALAEAMREQGVNYQRHLHVTAVDVDARAAHMAYMQFSLLHIPAVVVVGNSITLAEREHWYTPAHVLGGWGRRLQAAQRQDLPALPCPRIEAAPPVSTVQLPSRPAAAQLVLF